MKTTQAEIDSTIERTAWIRHLEAIQILGAAIRAPVADRRLGDLLTAEQIELLTQGCGPKVQTPGAWAVAHTEGLVLPAAYQPSPLRSNSDAGFGVKR